MSQALWKVVGRKLSWEKFVMFKNQRWQVFIKLPLVRCAETLERRESREGFREEVVE